MWSVGQAGRRTVGPWSPALCAHTASVLCAAPVGDLGPNRMEGGFQPQCKWQF